MTTGSIIMGCTLILQLGAVIFSAGKLWQRVNDIEETVADIKKIVFKEFDCEKGDGQNDETQEVGQDRSPSERKKKGMAEKNPSTKEEAVTLTVGD